MLLSHFYLPYVRTTIIRTRHLNIFLLFSFLSKWPFPKRSLQWISIFISCIPYLSQMPCCVDSWVGIYFMLCYVLYELQQWLAIVWVTVSQFLSGADTFLFDTATQTIFEAHPASCPIRVWLLYAFWGKETKSNADQRASFVSFCTVKT